MAQNTRPATTPTLGAVRDALVAMVATKVAAAAVALGPDASDQLGSAAGELVSWGLAAGMGVAVGLATLARKHAMEWLHRNR